MRRFTTLTILLASALCCVSPGLSFEYDEEPRTSYVSRRAIDGTRGRKYFDPKEDGFFEDYGYDRGQYRGSEEKTVYEGLKSNVPGEPGVDYPAYATIPKTSFTCNDRARGYYADEEAGCQVFHVCDGGLVSSFLCPVGSLFSQRLLTCDWWSKVPCSQSQQFYEEQSFDSETLRQTLAQQMAFQPQDQRQETDRPVPAFADVRPNENQLAHADEKKQRGHHRTRPSNDYYQTSTERTVDDSPIVRVKVIEDDQRKTRFRGHSSFRSSDVGSQGQRQHPSHGPAPPTEPSVTANPSVAEESRASPVPPTAGHETPFAAHQDSATSDAPAKNGLEELAPGQPEFAGHNAALEYDDMEGKESIGLVNSQAERNLERQDARGKPVTREPSTEAAPQVYTESATDATVTDAAARGNGSAGAAESPGSIVSGAEEKFQPFDGERATVTEGVYNSTERIAEETVTPTAETLISSAGYQGEASTVPPANETRVNDDAKVRTEKVKTPTHKSQVRKMSGFRINVIEKKRKTTTALPVVEEEPASTDYHELLNSSDTSCTSTISPVTVSSSDEYPTTLSNNVRRVSDAVEESNTPYGVTVSLNEDNYQRSLTRDEIIRQLISHQTQAVDPRNLGSHQTKYNQNQATDSTEGVSNNQNYGTHHSQFNNSPRGRESYQPPVAATTFRTFPTLPDQFVSTTTETPRQAYDEYKANDESSGLRNYHTTSSYQKPRVPSTTPTPVQNYGNYQNQDKAIDYTNYQEPQDEYSNTKYPLFVSTTPVALQNIDITQDQDKPLDYLNYQTQQQESHSTGFQPYVPTTTEAPQQNYDYYQNQEKQENPIDYEIRPHLSHNTQQQTYVSGTTPIPQQNYDYYQNQDKHVDPINYQTTQSHVDPVNYQTAQPHVDPINYQTSQPHADPINYQTVQPHVDPINYQTTQPQESHSTNQNYVSSTTSSPQQNYNYYQNQENQEDSVNYQPRPHETKSTSFQSFIPSTTQVPIRNFVNYKNHQHTPEVPTNHRVNEEVENFRQPKKFFSTTVRNLLTDDDIRDYQNQQLSRFNTYRNQPVASSTIKYSPSLLDKPRVTENHNSQNLPQDFPDYSVNYQTHHYPDNFGNYKLKQEQSNEKPDTQSFENYQTTNYEQNHQSQQAENAKDDQSQKNVNYPDYHNYDSTEDLVENTQFGTFGVRLNSKNQNANNVKPTVQTGITPSISPDADAHSINAGLQGKTSNFLIMMSQLLKNDRLPRPFAQNNNKVNQNFVAQSTDYNNNVNQRKPAVTNGVNVFNQNNTSSIYSNVDYNNNVQQNQTQDQYDVIVDEFAAPRLLPHVNNIQPPSLLNNIFLNQAINNNKAFFAAQFNKQQNISDHRRGRILNHKPTTSAVFESSTPTTLNPYNTESTPQFNDIPVNGNQFVPIQPDYSSFSVGNVAVPSEDLLPPKESEPLYVDYLSEQNTQSSIESTRVPINNFNPLTFDFNYEQTTQQSAEQTRFPSINLQVFKNTQSPVDFGLSQHSQENHRSTPVPNLSFETSQPSSFDYGFYQTTPQSVEHTAVPNNDAPQSQTIDYEFRPTVLPPSKNQDIETADQRYNNFNVTRMVTTTKTTVETEFIPSLSFDFGSDEGRKEYLEALEKGLVSSEESRNSNSDSNSAASANEDQTGESNSSEKSDVMSNFKDTTDVMSSTE